MQLQVAASLMFLPLSKLAGLGADSRACEPTVVFKIKASVFISLLLCNHEWNNHDFFPGTQMA